MNIFSFEGPQGNGKSTTLAMFAAWWHEKENRKVISNMPLTIPYTPFSLEYLKEHLYDDEIGDCVVVWDEANQLCDAHAEASHVNSIIEVFAGSARKRKVDLLIAVHDLSYLGRRLRIHVVKSGIRSYSRCVKEKPCRKCKGTGIWHEETCDECLGYKDRDNPRDTETFVAHIYVTLYNRNRHWIFLPIGEKGYYTNAKRIPMEYPGNYYFHFFDSGAKVAMRKSRLDRMETDEVGTLLAGASL
jgi:hypothetical protein